MKVAICEDEQYWNNFLEGMVLQWASEKKASVECKSFFEAQSLINSFKKMESFDLLLLDIALGEGAMNGMAAAKALRAAGSQVPIVFVTAHNSHVIDSFLVRALGFVGKPADKERLCFFLGEALSLKEGARAIEIGSGNKTTRLRVCDIDYVEVSDHELTYHAGGLSVSTRGTLKDAISLLGGEGFVQVHKSYLVSVDKIYSFKKTRPYYVSLYNGFEAITLAIGRKYIGQLAIAHSKSALGKIT